MLNEYLEYLLEDINTDSYVYHIVVGNKNEMLKSFKKYGLASPRKLYEVDKELFIKTSYKIYKGRTAKFKGINESDVTAKDVIDYLDKSPTRIPEFSSRSLFFSFLPLSLHHKDFIKRVSPFFELQLPMKY